MSPDFVPNCLHFWICHLFKINKNSLKTFKSRLSVLEPQLPFFREICKRDSPLSLCWVVNHTNFLMAGAAPWLRQGWPKSFFEVSLKLPVWCWSGKWKPESLQRPFLSGGRRVCRLEAHTERGRGEQFIERILVASEAPFPSLPEAHSLPWLFSLREHPVQFSLSFKLGRIGFLSSSKLRNLHLKDSHLNSEGLSVEECQGCTLKQARQTKVLR